MVSQVASEKTVFRGLRPLDPTRDLGQLAKLIEEAFGDDISEGGQAALKDLRVLSRLGPLVFLLDYISPEFHEYFSGFVWIENGQVVGNTTVTRTGRLSYRWMISNVAVARAYRRQGIGRQLVAAAIEKARSAGGNDALLRVRVDNDPAQRLYEGFGFKQVAAVTEMELPALREVTPVPAEGFTLRRRHHSEWRQQLDLARQTVPAGMQRLRPVRAGDYRSDLDQRVGRWLGHFFAGLHIEMIMVKCVIPENGLSPERKKKQLSSVL
ncbi:MAG: GNAT family N-acetyltransferase [Chloroflexota bacterium]|nr:GNAT family N-acetyltransferase [Chloroflexota bacterium]